MRRPDLPVSLAAVGRLVEAHVEDVYGVLRLGVGVDAGVVEGPLPHLAIVAGQFPGGAAIVGDEHSAVFVLHDGVDAA